MAASPVEGSGLFTVFVSGPPGMILSSQAGRYQFQSPSSFIVAGRETYARELLADSASGVGYLLKDRVSDVGALTDALARVAAGGSALDPEVVSQILGRRRDEDPLDELTLRKREVLGLMAEGRSNSGIASKLVVTERAVEKHVTNIFVKLDLPTDQDDHRRILAVLAYLQI